MEITFWILAGLILLFGFSVFFGAPYVPSHKKHFIRAFDELYPLSDKDMLLDLGSGDGIVLREVSRRGAKAIGYELNPVLVMISRFLSRGDKNVQIILGNYLFKSFPGNTTIIYLFANGRDIKSITRKIQKESNKLDRTLYILSYAFKIDTLEIVKQNELHTLYKVIPLQPEKA